MCRYETTAAITASRLTDTVVSTTRVGIYPGAGTHRAVPPSATSAQVSTTRRPEETAGESAVDLRRAWPGIRTGARQADLVLGGGPLGDKLSDNAYVRPRTPRTFWGLFSQFRAVLAPSKLTRWVAWGSRGRRFKSCRPDRVYAGRKPDHFLSDQAFLLSDRHLTVVQSLPDRSDHCPSMPALTSLFAASSAARAAVFKRGPRFRQAALSREERLPLPRCPLAPASAQHPQRVLTDKCRCRHRKSAHAAYRPGLRAATRTTRAR